MSTLFCTVAIPTRELFAGEVASVTVPGVEGSYGVLPGHEMLVAINKSGGVLTLGLDAEGNNKKQFLLYEGAAEVFNDTVTILGRFGKCVDDIDVEDIREKRDELSQQLEEIDEDTEDEQDHALLETSRARLNWYDLQISYAEGSVL